MLDDKDSYVKKTAIYGCLKINQMSPEFSEHFGLVNLFYNLLKTPDTQIVVAIINALNEILKEEGGMSINSKLATYLISRIREFGDYGLGLIVDLFAKYEVRNEEEMLAILNAFDSRLRTNNTHLKLQIIKLFLLLT